MDWFMIVLLGAMILLESVVLGRALLAGTYGFSRATVRRNDDPGQYWTMTAISAGALILFAWLLLRHLRGAPPGPGEANPFSLIFAAMLAFWLTRFLVRGTASAAGTPFSRAEEPTQYWLIVALAAAAVAFLLWSGLGFP